MHCTTGLFELAVNFILFMSRSRCGLKNSGVEQTAKGMQARAV